MHPYRLKAPYSCTGVCNDVMNALTFGIYFDDITFTQIQFLIMDFCIFKLWYLEIYERFHHCHMEQYVWKAVWTFVPGNVLKNLSSLMQINAHHGNELAISHMWLFAPYMLSCPVYVCVRISFTCLDMSAALKEAQ